MESTTHRIFCADSFGTLPLDSESVDLIVTSPPYPMIEMWDEGFGEFDPKIPALIKAGQTQDSFERMHLLLDRTWKEVMRVLKPGGFACINIGDATRSVEGDFRMYNNASKINHSFIKFGGTSLPGIIWRKPTNSPTKFMGSGTLPAGAYVTLEHEHILIFRKGEKRKFTKDEMIKRYQASIFWEERNQWFSDVWYMKGTSQLLDGKGKRKRSASFPIELPIRLIHMFSIYGDVVLDPFGGLATTVSAAMACGRNSIAMEISQHLVDDAYNKQFKRGWKNRLNQTVKNRIAEHIRFIDSKDALFFRYKNDVHDLPVKTKQERKMQLQKIKSIGKEDGHILVKYSKWTKSDIHQLRMELGNEANSDVPQEEDLKSKEGPSLFNN
jgi:DNA modification methylase